MELMAHRLATRVLEGSGGSGVLCTSSRLGKPWVPSCELQAELCPACPASSRGPEVPELGWS